MSIQLDTLLILALATWRVSLMLVREKGPYQIFSRLRKFTTLGGLLECIYCMSVWSALTFYLIWYHTELKVIVVLFAISGLAMVTHRYTGGDHV